MRLSLAPKPGGVERKVVCSVLPRLLAESEGAWRGQERRPRGACRGGHDKPLAPCLKDLPTADLWTFADGPKWKVGEGGHV